MAKLMKETAPSIWAGGFENDGVLRSMVAVDLKMGRNYSQFLAVCSLIFACFPSNNL